MLGALAAPARADHKDAAKSRERVAAAAAAAVRTERGAIRSHRHPRRDIRTERGAGSLTTGDLALTGARAARRDAFLDAGDIAAEVHRYGSDIERCYLEQLEDVRRAGRLDLTFVIGRDGRVVSLAAAAPGLPARAVHKVESCIREAVDALHFPGRRAETTAIVPYLLPVHRRAGRRPAAQLLEPQGLPRNREH